MQKIIVDKLHPVTDAMNALRAKEGRSQLNVDYVTMELSVDPITNPNAGGGTGVIGQLLKGGFEAKRTKVFQSIHKDILLEKGVGEGDDLNAMFESPFGVAICELTDEEFNALSEGEQLGFSKKINPETKEELTTGGQSIWRKVVLGADGIESKFVAHDKVAVNAPAKEVLKA